MKLELIIFILTAGLVVNAYYDNKYLRLLHSWKKYFEMATYGFIGFSIYLMIKRNPGQSQQMLQQASNMIKYMPVDKDAVNMISPLFSYGSGVQQMGSMMVGQQGTGYNMHAPEMASATPQYKRMMQSGQNSTKRSVSESKKKWVASQQQWKCGDCSNQLQAWFEVDHRVRLEHGGSNHVNNLVALCRECHGKKTMMENISKSM
jgi:hypothetical protein